MLKIFCTGLLTTTLGALLFVLDHMFHDTVAEFFNLEDLCEEEHNEMPKKTFLPQVGQFILTTFYIERL